MQKAGFSPDEEDSEAYPLMRKMQRMLVAQGEISLDQIKMFCALKYPKSKVSQLSTCQKADNNQNKDGLSDMTKNNISSSVANSEDVELNELLGDDGLGSDNAVELYGG